MREKAKRKVKSFPSFKKGNGTTIYLEIQEIVPKLMGHKLPLVNHRSSAEGANVEAFLQRSNL